MVPEGWNVKLVGNLFRVQLGKMLNKEAREKKPQYQYLGNSNVKWGYFDLSDLKTMHFSEKDMVKFTLEPDDIVMCEGGEVGRCAIWRGSNKQVYYQKALHRLRSKGEIIPEYFQNYMGKIAGTKLLDDFTTRTSIAHLTREKLVALPVRVPPLPEQKKIAQILSSWDKAIETVEKLIENSLQKKKALMQQLLTGKKRFPGFDGEWKCYPLTEVAEIIVSPVDKKTIEGEVPVRLCNYTDVYYNDQITSELKFMDATATQREIDRYTLQVGDVIITKDSETPGDIAIPTVVSEELNGVVCGYHLAIIRPKDGRVDGQFLSYLFSMPHTRYYFFTFATGATRFGLSVGGITKAQFNLPPFREQIHIAKIVRAFGLEVESYRAQLSLLQKQKQALMQQLLTGKRRVKVN